MSGQSQAKDRYAHVQFEGFRHPEIQRIVPCLPLSDPPARPKQLHTPSLSFSDYSLLAMVLEHAGIKMGNYRTEALSRRLPACLRALRVRNSADACRKLQDHPACFHAAVDSLLIGVSQFFRDIAVFNFLEQTIIPDILSETSRCRALSVACSEGSELYSLAMLLAERGILHQSLLSGIDCRANAIAAARRGRFSANSVKNIPDDLLRRYFSQIDSTGATIDPTLKLMTNWHQADAFSYQSGQQWDILLCRNFAIYLTPIVASALWNKLYAMLTPGGYLIVGKAERPSMDFIRLAPCIYRKPL